MNETVTRRSNDEIIRWMIEKENDYIHYRVTWLCTIEGLLLTAFSFAFGHLEIPHLIYFVYLLCVLGIAVAGIILHPIWYAHRTMMGLLDWWDEHKKDYDGPDVIGGRPKRPSWRKVGPWHLLAVIFGVAWLVIFIFSLLYQLRLIA